MIMNKTVSDLGSIARSGGSLEVDGMRYTAMELGGVARSLREGAYLRICNSDKFSASDLGGIARSAPGQVIFC